jgi:hypothetical protein
LENLPVDEGSTEAALLLAETKINPELIFESLVYF